MRFNLFKDRLQVFIDWPWFTICCILSKHLVVTVTNTLSQKAKCQYYYSPVFECMTKFSVVRIGGITIWIAYRRPRKFAR